VYRKSLADTDTQSFVIQTITNSASSMNQASAPSALVVGHRHGQASPDTASPRPIDELLLLDWIRLLRDLSCQRTCVV